jgi:5-methylcytosine-specific restriction endonuclease McrA
MKITNFGELWQAVNKIKIDTPVKIDIEAFIDKGLDTNLSDVYAGEKGGLYTVLKDGSIRKTIVHICDISNYSNRWDLPKFHIFECSVLIKMKNNDRSHRYKKASKDNGQFWIIKGENKSYEFLNICQKCLSKHNQIYNYQKVENFNIKSYLDAPIQHILPYITNKLDMTTIPSSYADNWASISKQRKQYHKWICQKCFYDLSSCKKYLHTHHKNADITNNKYENLTVLCIECHAKEFQHGHIKTNPDYNNFLQIKEKYAS